MVLKIEVAPNFFEVTKDLMFNSEEWEKELPVSTADPCYGPASADTVIQQTSNRVFIQAASAGESTDKSVPLQRLTGEPGGDLQEINNDRDMRTKCRRFIALYNASVRRHGRRVSLWRAQRSKDDEEPASRGHCVDKGAKARTSSARLLCPSLLPPGPRQHLPIPAFPRPKTGM